MARPSNSRNWFAFQVPPYSNAVTDTPKVPRTLILEPPITLAAPMDCQSSQTIQPRALGAAQVSVRAGETGHTRIANLRQSGCMKLVFPRQFGPEAEAILVNTAGGITGGDVLSLEIDVAARANLTLTTQACERAYRAQSGEIADVQNRVRVAADARLNWLPQELILFERCALRRRLTVDLEGSAQLLMVEPVVFGRGAMNEVLSDVYFQDRINILRDGRPLYGDGVQICGDATTRLARGAIANGAGAMATVVFIHPEAATHLSSIRANLPVTAGVSILAEDMIVLRVLGTDAYDLRCGLIPALTPLLNIPLPTSWRL